MKKGGIKYHKIVVTWFFIVDREKRMGCEKGADYPIKKFMIESSYIKSLLELKTDYFF